MLMSTEVNENTVEAIIETEADVTVLSKSFAGSNGISGATGKNIFDECRQRMWASKQFFF